MRWGVSEIVKVEVEVEVEAASRNSTQCEVNGTAGRSRV